MTNRSPGNTLVMEVHYRDEWGTVEMLSAVDGVNEVILELAHRFGVEILSISHLSERGRNGTPIMEVCSTVVCLANGQTLEGIDAEIERSTDLRNSKRLYCFCEPRKIFVRIYEISSWEMT